MKPSRIKMLHYLEKSLRKERNLDTSSQEPVTYVERWDTRLMLVGKTQEMNQDIPRSGRV
jgi:hypothetical protein